MMSEGVLGRGSVNTGAVEYGFRRLILNRRDSRQVTESALGKTMSCCLSGLPNAAQESLGRCVSVTALLSFPLACMVIPEMWSPPLVEMADSL